MTPYVAPVPNPQDPYVQTDIVTVEQPAGNPWAIYNANIDAPQPVMSNRGRSSSHGNRGRSESRGTRRVSIQLDTQTHIPGARRDPVRGRSVNRRPSWVCCAFGHREDALDQMYDNLIAKEGLDEAALMSLWLLLQLSPEGRIEAEDIYAMLSAHDGLYNPSGYIANGIENARRKLNPDGEKYKNMSGIL